MYAVAVVELIERPKGQVVEVAGQALGGRVVGGVDLANQARRIIAVVDGAATGVADLGELIGQIVGVSQGVGDAIYRARVADKVTAMIVSKARGTIKGSASLICIA